MGTSISLFRHLNRPRTRVFFELFIVGQAGQFGGDFFWACD